MRRPLFALVLCAATPAVAREEVAADLELVLAVDISGSVDAHRG